MFRTEFQQCDLYSLNITVNVAGSYLGHRELMETYVPTRSRKAAVLLTPSLGLAGLKLLFTNILGRGLRGGGGKEWVYNMELIKKLRLTEGLQNLASSI